MKLGNDADDPLKLSFVTRILGVLRLNIKIRFIRRIGTFSRLILNKVSNEY